MYIYLYIQFIYKLNIICIPMHTYLKICIFICEYVCEYVCKYM